jgi:tRNA threonylcarbamoyladenosine biosynthesis protein TsaB
MIILAIETTGTTCGAAVFDTGKLLSIVETYEPNVHDAMLASQVQQALTNCSLTITDIDVVAVSGGPGSFTGTRIGVSFAKGLCFDGTPKLLVIDTMDALATASTEVANEAGKDITVVIPSHRSLYFAARYHVVDKTTVRRADDEHTVSTLLSLEGTKSYAQGSMVVGPGAIDVDATAISGLTRLSSRFVALSAVRMFSAEEAVRYADPLEAEPLYRQGFKA